MNEVDPFQPELFELPQEVKPFEYQLLKGHSRTDKSFKSDDQLRSEYVHLTDALILKMTEGVKVQDPKTGENVTRVPDVVVWLDKSARPVSWLTKELWGTLATDENGNTPKLPDFRYANIDREQWVNHIDPQGSGMLDINLVSPSIIRSLRSLFISPIDKQEGLTESIDSATTDLDGKTVLIVDEVRASGKTLDIAQKFFKRAFPDTAIATTHWMGGVVEVKGARGNADLPVWYKKDDIKGRGVGNRDERISQKSASRTQRLGAWFLSTRLAEGDTDSKQLRAELHKLAEDVKTHEVLVVPANGDIDTLTKRAERLNGVDFDTFLTKRNELRESS